MVPNVAMRQYHNLEDYISQYILAEDGLSILVFMSVFFICLSLFFSESKGRRHPLLETLTSILFGVFCLFIGLFPYWVLGYAPAFWDWYSRFQLLMPFSIAIIIVAVGRGLPICIYKLFYIFIISLSVSINLVNYYDFNMDWEKQKKIISALSQSEIVKNSNLVLFEDRTDNAMGRQYRFYEWCGLLNKAFAGDRTKFGINARDVGLYQQGNYDGVFKRFYTTGSHTRVSEQKVSLVRIKRGTGDALIDIQITRKDFAG